MPADREPPTLADYAVTAVSPALIMLMVGSLVFFLVTVLPTGDYQGRLLYTSFFFVFGAVLVARIAIQVDSARATMYGLALGLVVFLAMSAYVNYPGGTRLKSVGWLVNLGLMALIWWSAHKLTWDCTHIDENRDASGRGVLAAAGLSDQETGDGRQEPDDAKPEANPERKQRGKRRKESPFAAWTARWWAHHDKQKGKPHTPGVWVVYFSLAALPLFAVGQSLIPTDDADRRRATFFQITAYVGSGLGLLVTTSLLGLRRYLRQRKVKIPASLTAGWLGLGGVLIAAFLLLGAFLPRPHSEVPWFGLPRAAKSEREASKYAQNRDSAGKGEGAEGDVTEKGDGKASDKAGEKNGKSRSRDAKRSADQKGDESRSDGEASQEKDDRKGAGDAKSKDGQGQAGERGRSPPDTKLGGVVEAVARFLKWAVLAVVIIAVVIGVAILVLRYLAPFTNWARNLLDTLRNWWAALFNRTARARRVVAEAAAPAGPQRPPPFSAFNNPFDGGGTGRDPARLVEYTFAALDSWAWDRGHGRRPTETPLEFATRLGVEFPDFAANLRRLAELYARAAYSTRPLPADTVAVLEQVWDQMVHGADVVAVE